MPLVLSGHTHGGQVLLPGVGALAAREFPVLAGYARQMNTSLFVSRGVGTVYVPVRINCPPDVAVLTLRSPLVATRSADRQFCFWPATSRITRRPSSRQSPSSTTSMASG